MFKYNRHAILAIIITALYSTVKLWVQLECPSSHEQIENKYKPKHYYSAIKKTIIFIFADIMFAENGKIEGHHIKQSMIGSERGMLYFLEYMKSMLKSIRFEGIEGTFFNKQK